MGKDPKLDPDVILSRADLGDLPKIVEQVGRLSIAWAHLEYRVFGTFATLIRTGHPIAAAIFFSQRTTRSRLEMVRAVGAVVLKRQRGAGDSVKNKRLKKLLGEIGKLAGERNKYVHDPWGGQLSAPKVAYQLRLTQNPMRYAIITRAEILDLTRRIAKQAAAVHRFALSLEKKVPALHRKHGRPRLLTLELEEKAIPPKRTPAKLQRPPRP